MEAFIAAMMIIGTPNHIPEDRIRTSGEAIWTIATEMGEDPYLVAAVGWVETRWNPNARSKTKDCGILQVHLRYTKYTCDELKDLKTGIREGITKLRYWRKRFEKRERRKMQWVCHYNGGNVCRKRAQGYGRSVYRMYRKLKWKAKKAGDSK